MTDDLTASDIALLQMLRSVVEVVDPKSRTSGRWVVRGGMVPARTGEASLKLEEAL